MQVVTEPMRMPSSSRLRPFEYWRNIDKEIGDRIAKGVKAD
jgi:hypothetical protein